MGLTIPGSCEYIGDYAFYGCPLLGADVEFVVNDDEESDDTNTDADDSTDEKNDEGAGGNTGGDTEEEDSTQGPGYSDSNTFKVRYELILEEGIKHIGSRAFFKCTGLIDVTIPDSVTDIGIRAFYGCESLESVTVGSGLSEISAFLFYGCKNLEEVKFSDNLQVIDEFAFRGCEKLADLKLPKGLKTIGRYAFHGCNAITNIAIPKNVTTIGDFAFRKNLSVTSITLHSDVMNLGQHAFYFDNAATIYCESEEAPVSWSDIWNSSFRPIVWGCTLSPDKSYVVSFVKSASSIENADAINGILAPTRDGFVFDGWSLEDGGEVVYSASEIVNAEDGVELYAIWTPKSAQ